MADEDGYSLLGALEGDLADGLARHAPAQTEPDAPPGSSPAGIPAGPWRPRPAIIRTERSTGRLSEEARALARELMAAAGLVAARSSWSLRNGASGVTLAVGAVIDMGRNASRGAAFLIDHPVVSRLQCRVAMGPAGPTVANVGCVNPASVRRHGVDSPVGNDPVALADGDSVFVGDDVLLFTVHEVAG